MSATPIFTPVFPPPKQHGSGTQPGAAGTGLGTGLAGLSAALSTPMGAATYSQYQIIRRNGAVVGFEPSKISVAMSKAFLAVHGAPGAASASIREKVEQLTAEVVRALMRSRPAGGTFHIEDVQDSVELALMRAGEHKVAHAYVLYRAKRAEERARKKEQKTAAPATPTPTLSVTVNGQRRALDFDALRRVVVSACEGLDAQATPQPILEEALRNLYDGIALKDVYAATILAARTFVEQDPDYAYAAARLLLHVMRQETLGEEVPQAQMAERYAEYFPHFIREGVEAELLDERLLQFDLARLGSALKAERDLQFDYLGLQTLYDRYFLHIQKRRIELPQAFFMRVAMGLALNEIEREERAIEFYHLLSSFRFMSSTPTLFNSGTRRSQLSSCYLTSVTDDLEGIYDAIKENALLSKFAGGLGNDWTNVRALGSRIKGTNGESQGVVPFLKVVNDTAVAVNQGGKRKGAVCVYLETWHLDIEEFLELRKNTGDDRRRTHDMNTANWVPDLFMKRVMADEEWTLFSPSTCPDLHDKTGQAFEAAYCEYEARAARGEIALHKKVRAVELWRKMLSMLFETGHPWITFKDACNIRSPQSHVGVVHSSNLCTEITLNTSAAEVAVCNLGSINLVAHLDHEQGRLDQSLLRQSVTTAMRMLDNVIDINYYAIKKARDANLRHRPVGLGLMGFQDCLHALRIPYHSEPALAFADTCTEALCYYAYWASSDLALERGVYSSYRGSYWERGLLPPDTLELLRRERGGMVEADQSSTLDWAALRSKIQRDGMRNSNCVAIAPTATIANIIGVSASIEPNFANLAVKSNLSGEFTIINRYLVRDLKRLKLWDGVMALDLKAFDGSLQRIDRVPAELKRLYATAFEIEPQWLVEAAARRQKWIDQAQSLNLYMAGASGKKLDEIYKLAWLRGLKTTYYLRTQGATRAEKSTVRTDTLNAVGANGGASGAVHASGAQADAIRVTMSARAEPPANAESDPDTARFCLLDDPTCEACQ